MDIHTLNGRQSRPHQENLIPRAINCAVPSAYGRLRTRARSAMANLTTHIAAGTVVSGALATLTLAANVIAPENLIPLTMAGVLGSVLPDIDLKESRPSRAMFSGLAIFFSFAVLFSVADRYSIAELWLLWLGTLVTVRYGLHIVFHKMAVHRGTWHSILAALFSAVATAVVFGNVLDRHAGVAWLAAGFMFVGFLVHLALDEIYAVDIEDKRLKNSFGTALKLVDRRYPRAAAGMVCALGLAYWLAPSPSDFVAGLSSRDMWAGLNQRMLPKETWFGIVKVPSMVADSEPTSNGTGTSPITTGTLPSTATPPVATPPSQ